MVDEIVRKIEEEDKNEQIERMNKQRQTREYIAEYLRDRLAIGRNGFWGIWLLGECGSFGVIGSICLNGMWVAKLKE